MSPTILAGYFALFVTLGLAFVFVNLLVGRFLRPDSPNDEKLEVYECGEPTIGSSFVQFDLRFYVIALLFIIFDVEVALFFPWAAVFGKAVQLSDPRLAVVETTGQGVALSPSATAVLNAMGDPNPGVPLAASDAITNNALLREAMSTLSLTAIFDILIFFAVLMVGFAYVWRRGDLDWVRAVVHPKVATRTPPARTAEKQEPALAH